MNDSNRTPFPKPHSRQRQWHLLDARGKRLGRLACEIARIVMGKYSPEYSRQVDAGDFVVVVNAAHLTWTGSRKGKQTIFSRHSGYPGGLRMERLEDLHKRDPVKVLRILVSSMLPKATNQRARLLKRVKIYPEANHPHAAQKPQAR